MSGSVESIDNGFIGDDEVILKKLKKRLNDGKLEEVISLLKDHLITVDIMCIEDKKFFTLLHRTALHSNVENLKFIYNYAVQQQLEGRVVHQESKSLTDWVNSKNDEGTTVLHLAGFVGNLEMMKFLISVGADPQTKNNNGLSCCHIAAQGDQPISLCYLFSIGCDISIVDNKGGTALHWACYLGCENTVNFLLSIVPHIINYKDQEGLGPMSLAVLSGNARVVKKLLQRGANKLSADSNYKMPSDLARDQKFENIEQMLEDNGGWEEYCNIKQPFKPMNKSPKQVSIFVSLLLFVQASNIAFIFPFFDGLFVELSVWGLLNLLTLFGFFSAWLADPGVASGILELPAVNANKLTCQQNRSSPEDSSDITYHLLDEQSTSDIHNSIAYQRCNALLEVYSAKPNHTRICVECCIEKPKRSRHCEVCKKCVRVYDHHCPWINNCVGAANHRFFIIFILSLWLNIFSTIVFVALHITSKYEDIVAKSNSIFNWYANLSHDTLQNINIAKYVTCGISLLIAAFFFILHSILCYIQITNLFSNQTTFERYNKHANQKESTIVNASPLKHSIVRPSILHNTQESSFNPSLILSNPELNKMKEDIQKDDIDSQRQTSSSYCTNALTMCCLNKTNPEYNTFTD